MKRHVFLLFLLIHSSSQASKTEPLKQNINAMSFITAYDLANKSVSSNLNLTNNTGQALTVYGIYLYGVAWIHPNEDCTNGILPGQNSAQYSNMVGTIATPIAFAADQSVSIGQNYLYNMVYNWIYWYKSTNGIPACSLPGCTWAGDSGPLNWCLQLGAESSLADYTFSPYLTNVTPFSWPTDLINDYAYDLIPNVDNYLWLGPFTCSDKTLTCTAATPKFQAFQNL